MVLPLRPEDFTGILISEIDFEKRWISFGTRFGGRDFNKGRQSFVCPFPAELDPLLRICIDGRAEGPLLRSRAVYCGRRNPRHQSKSTNEIAQLLDRTIVVAPREEVQCENDCRRLFRRILRQLGGLSKDGLFKEVRPLLDRVGLLNVTPYKLRGSCNTEMDRARVSELVQTYVTGHATTDIIHTYVSLDPVNEMQKYFEFLRPLLDRIQTRAFELRISETAA